VPFVGSGLSVSVGRHIFPDWSQLIDQLAARLASEELADDAPDVRTHLTAKRFPEAAGDGPGTVSLPQRLGRVCDLNKDQGTPTHLLRGNFVGDLQDMTYGSGTLSRVAAAIANNWHLAIARNFQFGALGNCNSVSSCSTSSTRSYSTRACRPSSSTARRTRRSGTVSSWRTARSIPRGSSAANGAQAMRSVQA
jgi:hypothetical protein